ncbi:MAG: tetratricopeptide repeat protein [Candidatus Hydrothermae bacterium]|nr:tetratricopeptide repeat protein [Candidatus Hydrothermae bacterium]
MDVILHIGAHRTGTTTFQTYLEDNRDHLNEIGTEFWGPNRTRSGLFSGLVKRPDKVNRDAQRRGERANGLLQMELDRLEALVRTLLPGAGDHPRLEAYLTHWMAVGRRLQGRLEEARALHERALDIVRERGLRESWPVFLLEYARLLQRMGEMEEAGRMLERVRSLSQRYGDLKTALNASMDQAQWLLQQQRLEEAVQRFQEVLGEAEAQGDQHSVVRILHNLGALYLLYLGDVPRAREVLERCLSMREVHDEAVVLHVSRLLMGVIQMLTGGSPSLPEETRNWLARVPSRVIQALAHGFPQLGIPIGDVPHPLFPDPLTPETFGAWIERRVREGPHQLLRLALWWAESRDPSRVEAYRERYREIIRKAGLPEVYAAALPFSL